MIFPIVFGLVLALVLTYVMYVEVPRGFARMARENWQTAALASRKAHRCHGWVRERSSFVYQRCGKLLAERQTVANCPQAQLRHFEHVERLPDGARTQPGARFEDALPPGRPLGYYLEAGCAFVIFAAIVSVAVLVAVAWLIEQLS